jgi:uncharacterized membrane protein (UPF0182 family)
MSQSDTASNPRRRTRRLVWAVVGTIVVAIVLLFVAAQVVTQVLWYRQLGFTGVLLKTWGITALMFAIGFVGMSLPTAFSLWLSYRSRPTYAVVNSTLSGYQEMLAPFRRVLSWAVPIMLGIVGGGLASSQWRAAAEFVAAVPVGTKDPVFHLDNSFYMFRLPFLTGAVSFAAASVLISGILLLAVSYISGAARIEKGRLRIAKTARIHIAVTAAVYVVLLAVQIWLGRYSTLTDDSGLMTGAGYTDVNAVLPGSAILAVAALLVAAAFVLTATTGKWRLSLIAASVLVVSSLVVGLIYPWGIQQFQVKPSERGLESTYLQRNIAATRAAYGLNQVKTEAYQATTDAQTGALRQDAETTAQIRLLDPSLVSDTFRQLQQYKQYYSFAQDLNVDRYQVNGQSQDTVIAVRELNQSGLGSSSRTWYNDHIVYTHGYGVVAAYGNQRTSDGEPVFLESGIPSSGKLGKYEPRVYFGENSPQYSIVGGTTGQRRELDYPASTKGAAQQTYTTYRGNGGPKLSNPFVRLLYSLKFGSQEIFLSDAITDQSQILYDRDPAQRVQKAAPYLTIDSDPYPAVVDGRVQWIIDGYTTSDGYPYSKIESYGDVTSASGSAAADDGLVAQDRINYIRNSVKATVDAYTGKVTLYAWDAKDPVLRTWQKVYPNTVKSMKQMSAQLISHVRYPSDLFKAQRDVLGTYHVTDPGSFYSLQDAWQVPKDPQADKSSTLRQPPYYLTMKLPSEKTPSFQLYTTYIPANNDESASRNVLTGYLAASSDAGDQAGKKGGTYGRLTLLQLPSDTSVPGPGQMQNQFDSDETVSTQLNLLRQGKTKVEPGNLLTLPVGGGLLYVQPVYVRSSGETSFPLLRKVLVAFGDKIAFEDTLDAALNSVFGGDSGANAGDSGAASSNVATDDATGSTGGDSGAGGASSQPSAALKDALQRAQQAMVDRQAALKQGDWSAYGTADAALQQALQDAIAAQ